MSIKTTAIFIARSALSGWVLMFLTGMGVVNAQVQLSVQPGVQLSWLTNTNDTYRLQWSSNPASIWTDLLGPVTGNGGTNTVFDPIPGGTRLYRVLDIIPGTPAI